jgi:hypothetical protein
MHPQGVVSTVLIVMGVAILLFENSLSVHFQQYFSYIVAVSFIDVGNQSAQ